MSKRPSNRNRTRYMYANSNLSAETDVVASKGAQTTQSTAQTSQSTAQTSQSTAQTSQSSAQTSQSSAQTSQSPVIPTNLDIDKLKCSKCGYVPIWCDSAAVPQVVINRCLYYKYLNHMKTCGTQ